MKIGYYHARRRPGDVAADLARAEFWCVRVALSRNPGFDWESATVRNRTPGIPVLILGGPWQVTLSLIRSLGRKSIPLFATGTGRSFVSYSRWHRAAPAEWGDAPARATLSGFLTKLPVDRMVLIPCSDEWALAVARLAPPLAARFPASLASLEGLTTLIDKGRFAGVLEQLGLPHPRTVCVNPEGDWAHLRGDAFVDAFLKPRDSQAFVRRYGVKALHFKTPSEAIALALEARQAGLEVMLQEYIPGPPTHHYMVEGFVDRTGRVCARFVRQRLRMFPPDFGDSTYMVSVPLDRVRAAVEYLDRLLAHLSYRGVFEAEFKYDERDGQFKLLEVNARPWFFIGFAADCGVDLCEMAYWDALSVEVEPVRAYAVGRHCVVGSGCWQLFRQGRLTAWAWLRSRVGARQLLFSWDDPFPGFARLFQHVWIVAARKLAGIKPRLIAGRKT
jgi:predicted ATP-grasp superfamily ATP-dependent carboligase